MIPDHANKAITDYIVSLSRLDGATVSATKAKAEEEESRLKVHRSMLKLAESVGYNKGDPPLVVKIPGEDRVIRFYTIDLDRRCGSGRDEREIRCSIERFA